MKYIAPDLQFDSRMYSPLRKEEWGTIVNLT